MKTRQLLVGALIGLTAGAVIGVLFAPKKGSVTRRFISQKGSKYVDEMKDGFNESLKTINQKIDTLKDEVKSMINKASVKTDEEFKRTKV